jgi:hypothetical protein
MQCKGAAQWLEKNKGDHFAYRLFQLLSSVIKKASDACLSSSSLNPVAITLKERRHEAFEL